MENRFNLVDEPWIPVAGKGLASLSGIFSDHSFSGLGGNPVQKIALTKLLLAIVQAAYTPKDDDDWNKLGVSGMARKALDYLKSKKELFWLYGDKPFLQMPEISKAEIATFGGVQPYVATGNTTVLTQVQIENQLTDAEKAVLVVQLMGFGLGGKKTDNSVILSRGYLGKTNLTRKPTTGKPGPALGYLGFLHSFVHGTSLQESLWLNMLTLDNVKEIKVFSAGLGTAPWENMPAGEICTIAKDLKESYFGRLIPISRFILLSEKGLHYSEGIAHPGYADGVVDPSVAADFSGSKAKVIWVDPSRRPWRQLTALLSFFESGEKGLFDCLQLRVGILRIKTMLNGFKFRIWSGGLRVSSNAGEQYVSGLNDFVESEVRLDSASMGDIWFANLKKEMSELENISKITYSATMSFFKSQKVDGRDQAAQASNLFWQFCEIKFQQLVNACNGSDEDVKKLRHVFAGFVNKAYNAYCQKDTARQLDAWAANQPGLSKYLS